LCRRKEIKEAMKLRIQFLSLLLSLLVSSCGNLDVSSSYPDSAKETTVASIGTKGKLITIQSSNVNAAGYDEVSMVMTVQFKNGALYEYYGVSSELWVSFVAAQPDPWSQIGYPRLVQAGLAYKRVR
jgi:hypothetical protein